MYEMYERPFSLAAGGWFTEQVFGRFLCICALCAVVCRRSCAAGRGRERGGGWVVGVEVGGMGGGLLFFLLVVYLEVTVESISAVAMFGFY